MKALSACQAGNCENAAIDATIAGASFDASGEPECAICSPDYE